MKYINQELHPTFGMDINQQFNFYKNLLLDFMSNQVGISVDELSEDEEFSFIMGCYPSMIISRHIGSRTASIVIYQVDEETFEIENIFTEGL